MINRKETIIKGKGIGKNRFQKYSAILVSLVMLFSMVSFVPFNTNAIAAGNSHVTIVPMTKLTGTPTQITEWDYVKDYTYDMYVTINPGVSGTNRTLRITAPEGFRFVAPKSFPEGITDITYLDPAGANQGKNVLISIADSLSSESATTSLAVISAGESTSVNQTNIINTVANEIKTLNDHPEYIFTAVYYDNETAVETHTINMPVKSYKDSNIFEWFQMYSNGGATFIDIKTMRMNGYGVIGYNSANGFSWGAVQANFALENKETHEPYWDLSLKVYLPNGITTVNPALNVQNDNDGKGDYFILDSSFAASTGVNYNASRMLLPTADITSVGYGPTRSSLYVNDLMLRLEPGSTPQNGHLYEGSQIEVTYTTVSGTKTELLNPLKIQCTFTEVDNYIISNPVTLDFAQGFDGNSDTRVIRLSEVMMNNNNNVNNINIFNSYHNNLHIGGTLTFDMGPNYEVYGMNVAWAGQGPDYMPRWTCTFPTDAEVIYYINSIAYTDAVRTGDSFDFPSAAEGEHVDKVMFTFPTGFDLREGYFNFGFDLRVLEDLPDNVNGQTGLHRSNIKITLADDSCADYPAMHTANYNVDLRAPRDVLLLQTYGGGNGVTVYPFLNEIGTQANDYAAQLAFGYNTFNGNIYVSQSGAWMTYHDVEIVFTGTETLAMMNGVIDLRADLLYTDLYFEYTTNKDPSPHFSASYNSGDPEGTARGIANTVNLGLDIADGEYLTSLTLHADMFKNINSQLIEGNIWNRDGNGGKISFRSRTDRTLPNDRSVSVPNYTDPSSGYTFDAHMTSSDSKASAKDSTVLVRSGITYHVRFALVKSETLAAISGAVLPIEVSAGTKAQGETFTINVTRGSTGNINLRLLNSELWLRVDPHFVFLELVSPTGLEYDVFEYNGQTYIIIKEDNEFIRAQNIQVTYTLRMMSLPSTPVGAYAVFDAGWFNVTDTLDPEKNGIITPYTYGVIMGTYLNNVDAPANHSGQDINQNSIDDSGETLLKMVTANTNITPSVTTGVTVLPGINRNFANTGNKPFYASDANELTLYSALGGASFDLYEYEAIFYIPTNGQSDSVEYSENDQSYMATSEFPMVLRRPISLDTAGLNEQIQYSKTNKNGPWFDEAEISDWSEIRCVRIYLPIMPGLITVGATFDLSATQSQNEFDNGARAYIAGDYQYEVVAGQMRTSKTNLATFTALQNTIEGLVWMDSNADGTQDSYELQLSGVKVTLLKLKYGGTPTNEADYSIIAAVETGYQKDLITNAESAYETGKYSFTNVPIGTYAVRFESGTASLAVLTASPLNIGDNKLDSDAVPSYNSLTAKLEKTVITNIVLPKTEDANAYLYESQYYDSGFYETISYTFTKIAGTDTSKPLSGAQFAVYKSTHIHDGVCGGLDADRECSFISQQMADNIFDYSIWNTDNPVCTVTSNENGDVTLTGLGYGMYILVELKAPEGYLLSNGCWILEVKPSNENPVTITGSPEQSNVFITLTNKGIDKYFLPNYENTVFPASGGIGTTLFTISGIILICTATLIFILTGKSKKRKAKKL